jgi:tetrahydromethanopterin S-methyltransferase subunit E
MPALPYYRAGVIIIVIIIIIIIVIIIIIMNKCFLSANKSYLIYNKLEITFRGKPTI